MSTGASFASGTAYNFGLLAPTEDRPFAVTANGLFAILTITSTGAMTFTFPSAPGGVVGLSLSVSCPSTTLGNAPINRKPTTRTATGPNEGGGPLAEDLTHVAHVPGQPGTRLTDQVRGEALLNSATISPLLREAARGCLARASS